MMTFFRISVNKMSGEISQNDTTLRYFVTQTVEEFEDVEVVVAGSSGPSAKINRKRDRAEKLFLHYIQR